MKKLATLFAAFALMLTLSACTKTEETPPVDTTPEVVDTLPADETGLVTEEDTENTGDKTFDAALQELELTK